MPPHRKPRRFLPTTSFYDKAGAIADGSPPSSPTTSSFGMDGMDDDAAYTLTAYGELSTTAERAFMLPPSPTQTIKYRYRAYRPKLARLAGRKHRSSASASVLNGGPLKGKGKSSADYASILNAYLSGTPGQSPRRDFKALLQKCRDAAAEGRQERTSYGERLGRGGDVQGTARW
ncbi:hypothetical protein C8Q77DRAFT_1161272 [Trametes polyzona]|nr:hypothetical protein C8Q77DRAFT_1161272 [Trametes polyzona]